MVSKFTSDLEKTLQFQDSLPSLPAPDLEVTLQKYLDSVKPHLSAAEFQHTSQIVKDFGTGVGRTLHNDLLKKIKGQRNWLEKLWEEKAYLEGRTPTNPFINIVGPGPFVQKIWPPKEGSQVERAAMITYYLVVFFDILRKQRMKVDKAGKTPLCMNQFMRVFNSCKTPGLKVDKLNFHFKTEEEGSCSTKVIVLCRGRIFSVDACTANKEYLTPPELQKQLQYIRDKCDREPEGPGLSALTCGDRNTWAKMYERILELHPNNRHNMKRIETALAVLALDDTSPAPTNTEQLMCLGIGGDAKSRWADKMTGAVFTNGTASYNVDHAPYDGLVGIYILHYLNQCLEATDGEWKGSFGIRTLEEPQELEMHLDREVLDAINQTFLMHRRSCANVTLHQGIYTKFGKSLMKKLKFHPDTFCQLALQLAYYRLEKKNPPTYETASTRKFWHGRTETLRVCTTEMVEFTKTMLDPSASNNKKLATLKAAYQRHNANMVDCSNFKGCDRHLLALYITALEQGLEIPELYTDKAYTASGGGGNFTLSTSFVGHTEATGGCAAMVENGYGVFYSIENERVVFNITCYKTGGTDAYKFFDCIKMSLAEIAQLLQDASKAHTQESKL